MSQKFVKYFFDSCTNTKHSLSLFFQGPTGYSCDLVGHRKVGVLVSWYGSGIVYPPCPGSEGAKLRRDGQRNGAATEEDEATVT